MTREDLDKYVELCVMFDTFKFIPRLGTKRIPIADKESVAIHIYEMTYLAYLSFYSMKGEDRKQFDLLKIIKLILWHEADESITNDIPYPAKRELKENGFKSVLTNIKDVVKKIIGKRIPVSLGIVDNSFKETFDNNETSNKKFVKLLDYVNLYLNSISLCNRGYNIHDTVSECKKLTQTHEYYSICPLVQELIENPNNFIDKEYN